MRLGRDLMLLSGKTVKTYDHTFKNLTVCGQCVNSPARVIIACF